MLHRKDYSFILNRLFYFDRKDNTLAFEFQERAFEIEPKNILYGDMLLQKMKKREFIYFPKQYYLKIKIF